VFKVAPKLKSTRLYLGMRRTARLHVDLCMGWTLIGQRMKLQ
jgi:hypothetical protein